MPCAFEAVLQVYAGERCGQLAQIRGWGADRAGQLAETPVGEGDGLGSTRPPPATAIAGGGQFHNLRSPAEIATTFMGELGELLAVAVRDVRLEIEGAPGTTAEMISPHWMSKSGELGWSWSVTLGDLLAGEDRHAVVRFGFMTQLEHTGHLLRARLVWVGVDGQPASSLWQELFFEYADHALERAHTLAGRHDKQLVQSGPLVAIRCRR